jgi:arylsulfatase A-like enzyme
MKLEDEVFTANLRLPEGGDMYYTFWVTKGEEGYYKDYWDQAVSGSVTVNNSDSITRKGTNRPIASVPTIGILSKGWIILLFLFGTLLLMMVITKNLDGQDPSRSILIKSGCILLSLLVFHLLARIVIIEMSIRSLLRKLDLWPPLLDAGKEDMVFVLGLGVIMLLLYAFIKHDGVRKWLFRGFLFLGIILTFVALINIQIVNYLGRPLNYQWLYYSDFLGSGDAISSISTQLTRATTLNMLALVSGMLLLSAIFYYSVKLIKPGDWRYRVPFILLFAVTGSGILLANTSGFALTNGKKENAVLSLLSSWVNINAKPSLYDLELSPEVLEGTELVTSPIHLKNGVRGENPVRNVVLLVLESAGAEYMDSYGGNFDLTPRLNELQTSSLRFQNAYAHAPGTNRSLISLLGSIYPKLSYESITQEHSEFQLPTVSSLLKEEGYRTSFFSSADLNFQNSREFLSNRGFDRIADFEQIPCETKFNLSSKDYEEGNGIDDHCLSDQFRAWLEEGSDKPFFSVLWTVQAHYPYYFSGTEKDYDVPNVTFNRYLNILNHYDQLVGKITDILAEKGLMESTLLIVTGDHGEAFGQHDQFGHGSGIYEENIRVPLYFINPVLFKGELNTDPVGLKDIPSTILPLLNYNTPDKWQGYNLLDSYAPEVYFFAPWSDHLFGLRTGNLKYIFNETTNTVEVFDLGKDSMEVIDIHDQVDQNEITSAKQRLARWVQTQDSFIKANNLKHQ